MFKIEMASSLLGLITGISLILNGSSYHFSDKDYQEKNQNKGIEVSTNLSDTFFKDSEVSFYYKQFVNSFNQNSETIGANVKLIKFKNKFLRLNLGYTGGLVKGYDPTTIYQDDSNQVDAATTPYLLCWTHFAIQPLPKVPLLIGADFNCAATACGWQSKITLETKF